jgi:hypothetical protein
LGNMIGCWSRSESLAAQWCKRGYMRSFEGDVHQPLSTRLSMTRFRTVQNIKEDLQEVSPSGWRGWYLVFIMILDMGLYGFIWVYGNSTMVYYIWCVYKSMYTSGASPDVPKAHRLGFLRGHGPHLCGHRVSRILEFFVGS